MYVGGGEVGGVREGQLAAELLIPCWQQNWVGMEKCFLDDGVTKEPYVLDPHKALPCGRGHCVLGPPCWWRGNCSVPTVFSSNTARAFRSPVHVLIKVQPYCLRCPEFMVGTFLIYTCG